MNDPKATAWLTKVGGLAKRLEAARIEAFGERSGLAMARQLNWSSSKITRIEQGTQIPTAADIEAWAEACRLSSTQARELHQLLAEFKSARSVMRQRSRKAVQTARADASVFIDTATLIRTYSTWSFPPILQIEEYAVAVLNEQERLSPETISDPIDALGSRMQRQRLLFDDTREFQILIDEAVLYRRHGGADALRRQLQYLLTLDGRKIAIVPFGISPQIPAGQSISMYDEQAFTEQITGDQAADPAEAILCSRLLEQLWAMAVTGDAAGALIHKALAELG